MLSVISFGFYLFKPGLNCSWGLRWHRWRDRRSSFFIWFYKTSACEWRQLDLVKFPLQFGLGFGLLVLDSRSKRVEIRIFLLCCCFRCGKSSWLRLNLSIRRKWSTGACVLFFGIDYCWILLIWSSARVVVELMFNRW